MAEALRIVSVERGHDAREFSLVAFGGAGPVHAAALAEELDIPEVIIPPIPGGFSALGLVATDLRRDWSRTFYSPIESIDPQALDQRLADLERAAQTMLRDAGIPEPDRIVERAADCRYTKQAYELTVPLAGGTVTRESLDALARAFHAQHLRTYGTREPERVGPDGQRACDRDWTDAAGRVSCPGGEGGGRDRVEGRDGSARRRGNGRGQGGGAGGVVRRADSLALSIGRHDLGPRPCDRGAAARVDAGGSTGIGTGAAVDTEIDTGFGTTRPGPFIVEEMDCTVVVPPGWSAALDERGFILMSRSG